ncbi:hypothetical protein GGR54DRAFT_633402 [Hypoxylon sp. NC1633]|nr:hypothetical protein GGR54DRAFT_633402 [Hypoxylon sp. NC1633]
MRDKTKAYHEWALAVVNNTEHKLFDTEKIRHPWQEDYEADWKSQIFELEGDRVDDVGIQFDDARDLFMYLENTPKDGTSNTNRRIILLEEMHPRIIEFLGVKLDIPPHFFLAHCDEYVDLSIIDRSFAKQDSSTYWKVAVPQHRRISEEVPNGEYHVEAGNFHRTELLRLNKSLLNLHMRSYVSYWGKSYGSDSWTAVILTDPRSGSPSRMSDRYELDDFLWSRDVFHEVINTGIGSDYPQPYQRSIHDAAVTAYSWSKPQHTKNPFTGTIFIRNIIRPIWEEYVYRQKGNMHDTLLDDRFKRANAFQPNKSSRDAQDLSQDGSEEEWRSWKMIYEMLARTEAIIADHMEMWSQRAAFEQTVAANRSARTSGQITKIATIVVPGSFVASIFSMGRRFAAGEDYFYVYWAISIPVTILLLAWVLLGDNIQNVYELHKARVVTRGI